MLKFNFSLFDFLEDGNIFYVEPEKSISRGGIEEVSGADSDQTSEKSNLKTCKSIPW